MRAAAHRISCGGKTSALLLLVLRVRADYHDTTLATNDLALLANRFYRRSYFH